MSANEQELEETLHALASVGPQEAPARLEDRLLDEFRRRSRLRRRRTWWSAAGVGAIAAGLAVLLWIRAVQPGQQAFRPETYVASDEAAAGFYPLPDADALPPVESALVVRVELPMASLALMGVPINQARATERVEADVLLGQDGLARGVRLIE